MTAGAGRPVEIVDTTTRDGNQSLWSATGLTARETLAIAPTLERVGFHALDFTSSTHMAVSVRFHREDPWELIRLMRAATPTTLLNFITTGMRFIAWQPCDEDVMRLAFRCVVRNGIRRFQFAEPANDPEALRRSARIAREEGVEEIVVGLTYSISPVHTHAYYAERVAALADCSDIDRFYFKDPGGLLTTDAVRELGPHFAATGRTVELHSHCTIGLAPLAYMEGLRAGFDVLHTAVGPAGNGTSQPTAESTLRNLEAEGYEHALDTAELAAASAYFQTLVRDKGLPAGVPREYDAAYYHHQLPGGMVTTTRRMLEEIRRPELFDAVLDEVVRVRAEMGYPILVTPVSQLVAFQATRNVIDPERWLNVSDETVRYFLGHYGAFAAPPDPDVTDRVLSLPKVDALRDAQPVSLDGARARFGRRISDEELLLRLTMPQEQVDAMRAAPSIAEQPALGSAGSRAPLVQLLRELERRTAISYAARREGRRPGGVAPCVLRRFAALSSTSTGPSSTGRARRCASSQAPARCSSGSGRPNGPTSCSRTAATSRRRRSQPSFASCRASGRRRAAAHAAPLRADVPRSLHGRPARPAVPDRRRPPVPRGSGGAARGRAQRRTGRRGLRRPARRRRLRRARARGPRRGRRCPASDRQLRSDVCRGGRTDLQPGGHADRRAREGHRRAARRRRQAVACGRARATDAAGRSLGADSRDRRRRIPRRRARPSRRLRDRARPERDQRRRST